MSLNPDPALVHPLQSTASGGGAATTPTPSAAPGSGQPLSPAAQAAGQLAAGLGPKTRWAIALVALWLSLTLLDELGQPWTTLGQALAGLILLGALYRLGPAAAQSAQQLFA